MRIDKTAFRYVWEGQFSTFFVRVERLLKEILIISRHQTVKIHKKPLFLGLPYPHPDPLITNTGPAPDPSIVKQK
jgi:hypothetical protein